MDIETINRYLERGDELGIQTETNDPNYLGWFTITKRQPNWIWEREAYDSEEQYQESVMRADEIKRFPYHVIFRELKRGVHESDVYESASDYRIWKNYYFSSLSEVEALFKEYGHKLEDLKPRREIDAP